MPSPAFSPATVHNGPIGILSLIRTGEAPDVRPTPATHPVGSIVVLEHQSHETPFIVAGWQEADRFSRGGAIVVPLESPERVEVVTLIHPHGTRRGIGWYQPKDQSQAVSAEEAGRLLAQARAAMDARRQAEADRAAAARRQEEAGRLMLALLGDCPAILVAELREDQSDSMTDYYGHSTVRRTIVGRLTSDRVSFKAWKKLCAAHPDPAIQALATGEEHRENYSMGGGYYLTAEGGGRHHGWCARSRGRPADGWGKSSEVCAMLAAGEHPWTGARILPAAEVIAAAEPAPAVEPIAAPEPAIKSMDDLDLATGGKPPVWHHRPMAQAPAADPADPVQAPAPIDPPAAPAAAGPLIWRPVYGEQTRQLRAVGLSVDALKAAGFKWSRDPAPAGMPFAWICDPATAEAAAILAKLTGQDPAPQGPGGGGGGGKPTDKPSDAALVATASPAPAPRAAAPAPAPRIAKALALADRLDKEAEAGERDRIQNTPKRLAQAMHARLDASRARRGAALLREWAADPSKLPGWTPNKGEAITARSREVAPVNNGFHGYHIETSEPYKTTDPQALALRRAYPEGAQAEDPKAKVEAMIARIRWADWPGFFPTPAPLAREVIRKADIRPGHKVLEPSAGLGDLADLAREAGGQVDVAEIVGTLREILAAKGYQNIVEDCLTIQRIPGGIYDRIVMNPSFENGTDVRHVFHCFDLLKPGGRLVAIMSKGWQFKSDARSQLFREFLEEKGATVEDNDPAAFASAKAFRQTGTPTVTVIIDRKG